MTSSAALAGDGPGGVGPASPGGARRREVVQ
jgi:hypothetical protein